MISMTAIFIAFVISQKNLTIGIVFFFLDGTGNFVNVIPNTYIDVARIELRELFHYSRGKSHFYERQIFFIRYTPMHSYQNTNE